jgi:hypothetical protein
LTQVASGPRIYRVERSRPGSGLVVVLGPADALRNPMPALELAPLDLRGGIGRQDRAVIAVAERLIGSSLLRPNMRGLPVGFARDR